VERLTKSIAGIVKTDAFRGRMESLGAEPMVDVDGGLPSLVKEDQQRWKQVIDVNGLKLQ